MTSNRYAAIVLAAGYSSRMKCFKPLLEVGGETITDRVISTFLHNGIEVCLVTGFEQSRLRDGIKTRDIRIIENLDFHQGMFSSIRAGLREMQQDHKAFFIMPVDIPLVRPFTIKLLLEAAENNPGKLFYPVFDSKRGHPPLIPREVIPAILDWQGEGGLKPILASHEGFAVEVKVPDRNILLDIDNLDDYQVLLERFQRYQIPNEKECEIIIRDVCKLAPEIYRHCDKVAEVADAIGATLTKARESPDMEVIHAAAMLHDIAKGQRNHPAKGSKILHEMGFGVVGDIVSAHHDLPEEIPRYALETKVVNLADKLVAGATFVSLDERFQPSLLRFKGTPDIIASIMRRKQQALNVKGEIEAIIGCSLERVIAENAR
jgi:molybdenum cofactor cytidylyltransferase